MVKILLGIPCFQVLDMQTCLRARRVLFQAGLARPGSHARQAAGYLPEAIRNYLARLSWSHGDEEIFSTQQARVSRGGVFPTQKGSKCFANPRTVGKRGGRGRQKFDSHRRPTFLARNMLGFHKAQAQ